MKGYRNPIAAHEFGHTLGSPTEPLHDEYNMLPGLGELEDRQSIMNIGHELRRRHMWPVLNSLNKLERNTKFDATHVSNYAL